MPYFQFNYNHNIKLNLVEIRLQKKFSALHLQLSSVLTLEGKEVTLLRLISLSRWSKAKFKSPWNFEELPYISHVIYENVDMVFIESIVCVKYFESDVLENIYNAPSIVTTMH